MNKMFANHKCEKSTYASPIAIRLYSSSIRHDAFLKVSFCLLQAGKACRQAQIQER